MLRVGPDTVLISFIEILNKILYVDLMSIYDYSFILGSSFYPNTYWEMSKYQQMIKAYSR
jgi:hypothetical protein